MNFEVYGRVESRKMRKFVLRAAHSWGISCRQRRCGNSGKAHVLAGNAQRVMPVESDSKQPKYLISAVPRMCDGWACFRLPSRLAEFVARVNAFLRERRSVTRVNQKYRLTRL